jgi:hypothetical protein
LDTFYSGKSGKIGVGRSKERASSISVRNKEPFISNILLQIVNHKNY